MPINWSSVMAFLAVATQWRIVVATEWHSGAAFSQLIWTGLDYTAVDVFLRRKRLPDQTFNDLQIMEDASLAAFQEAS